MLLHHSWTQISALAVQPCRALSFLPGWPVAFQGKKEDAEMFPEQVSASLLLHTKCLLPAAPGVGLGMGCEMMVVLPETLFVVALKIFILFYFRI